MPEDVATPSAPSPAAEAPQAPKQETVSVPTNAEDYAKWRATGELPESGRKPSKSEDSATSKKPSVDSKESETAPVSETGTSAGKRSAEKRIDQLTAEKEAFRRELEELKARAGKQDAKQPESSSVPQTQPAEAGRPKKPKQEEFKTWDEYETAQDKYVNDLVKWESKREIDEYIQRTKQEAATQAMQVRLDKAKERYGEEAETTIIGTAKTVFDDSKVAPAIKAAMGRSDVMVDALYVMGSDQKELDSFVDLSVKDPLEALRKWFTVEALVREELARPAKNQPPPSNGAPQRDEEGKFVSAKSPPARIPRQAPAPPTELGGSSSPPGDERDRAAASGDVRGFMQEGNRRDLARWKGQI